VKIEIVQIKITSLLCEQEDVVRTQRFVFLLTKGRCLL